jgi:hypothetical protein
MGIPVAMGLIVENQINRSAFRSTDPRGIGQKMAKDQWFDGRIAVETLVVCRRSRRATILS